MTRGTRRRTPRWLVMLVVAVTVGLLAGPLSVRIASRSDRLQLAEAIQQAQDELTAAQTAQAQAQAALDGETDDLGTNEGHEEWTSLGLYRYILLNAASNSAAYWDAQCAIDILTSGTNTTGHSYLLSSGLMDEGPVPDGRNKDAYRDIYKNVDLASRKDAVSLDNFKTALDFIDEFNEYRARENSEEGYSLSTNVGLNCRLMAIACVQLDVSCDYNAFTESRHTEAYKVGENLSWGYADPFYGWYDEEKVDYQNGIYNGTGHYLNIVDGLPGGENYDTVATGFAVHTGAPAFRVAYGQVFHTTSGYPQYYTPSIVYTTNEFRTRWFNPYYQQQLDAGMHGTDSTVHAQHVQALNDAKQRVATAQTALQSAQTAYDNYVNLSSNSLVSIQVASATYTGSAITPSVTVSVDGEALSEGTDFTVGSYANNTNVGTATLVVSGRGVWSGSRTVEFSISPKSISSVTVSGVENKAYTGVSITQTPTITDGSRTLREGQDYTLSYTSNTNVGTVTMTITGKGNYTGGASTTFSIVPADLKNASIAAIPSQTYTGSALTPAPTVTMNGRTLQPGTDYEVGYRDNINEGMATVTVTGKGNYTGTNSATFTISAKVLPDQVITARDVSITMLETGSVSASTSGDGTLSYVSSDTSVARVSSNGSVTPVSAGTAQITITASATNSYHAATKVVTVTVTKAQQTVTAYDLSITMLETGNVSASTSGDGTLGYESSSTGVVRVSSNGSVTPVSAGTARITVTASETNRYQVATKVVTVTVTKAQQTVTASDMALVVGESANVSARTSGDGTLSFTSSAESVATVDSSGLLRAVGAGTTKITIVASETTRYQAASKTITVRVTAPAVQDKWTRLSGSGRYDTMSAIVSQGFDSSDWAVIATGADFPDVLVASSLAGVKECPVVLTKSASLSVQAKEQLERLRVKNVYVMGGESAVSKNVESELKSMGIKVTRVRGSNRQATSLEAAKILPDSYYVVVATGGGFADALSIGPWCYWADVPILLTSKKGQLSKDQLKWLGTCSAVELIVVGGTSVVPNSTVEAACDALRIPYNDWYVTRLAGSNRYATSAMVAEWEIYQGMDVSNMAVATGKAFPDALAGAALCGSNGSVLALVSESNLTAVNEALSGRTSEVSEGFILGGEGVVSQAIMERCAALTR